MYKLNLGAGYDKVEGYVSIDYDKTCNPDYIVDLERDRLPFDDNSVDAIKAHHILEHLGDGFFHLMKEMYRVCVDGTIIDIVVPHPRHDFFLNDPTHKRPINVDILKKFSKAYNKHCEEIGDGMSKLGYMFDVDFDIVDYDLKWNPKYLGLVELAQKDEQHYRLLEQMISENNNMIEEIHINMIVIKNAA